MLHQLPISWGKGPHDGAMNLALVRAHFPFLQNDLSGDLYNRSGESGGAAGEGGRYLDLRDLDSNLRSIVAKARRSGCWLAGHLCARWPRRCQSAPAVAPESRDNGCSPIGLSGTAQSKPIRPKRLSTPRPGCSNRWRHHGSICRNAMPTSTLIIWQVWLAPSPQLVCWPR